MDSAAYPSTLHFIQRRGARLAIRLEDIFWSQIKDFAAEDGIRPSQLVFDLLDANPAEPNRTALLRCYCLDRWRRKSSQWRLAQLNFDMMAIIAACPAPVIVLTPERRIAAFNPMFSNDILKAGDTRARDGRTPVSLTFSEPLPSIYHKLLNDPRHISVYQIGVNTGQRITYHRARFALLDRSLGERSNLMLFLEN